MNLTDFYFDLFQTPKKFSLESYSLIKLSGSDCETFLQNQTTNDVKELIPGSFQTTTMLSNRGVIQAAFLLLKRFDSEFEILVQNNFLEQTQSRLEQFLISEEVEFEVIDHSYSFCFGVNQLESALAGVFLGESGFLSQGVHDFEDTSEINVLKLLSGYPEMSDLKQNSLLNNSSIINFSYNNSKGCFPGNETISKIESRKGAGFKDVLVFFSCIHDQFDLGEALRIDGRKVGSVIDFVSIEEGTIIKADLLRELRVEKKSLQLDSVKVPGIVYNLPFYNYSQKHIYFYDRAIEYFQNSEDENAIKYLKLAIKYQPDFADAYESLAVILGRNEKYEDAISLLDQLVEIDPKSVMAHTNLSMYHMKLGNIEVAEEHKSQATIKSFEMHGEAAKIKREQEEREKAEKEEELRKEGMFKQVLEIDAEDTLANYGLGEIHFKRKEFEIAEKHLNIVLGNDPNYSVGYLLLGKIQLSQGQKSKAQETFKKGIDIAAKNGDMMPANEMQRLIQA